MSARDIFHNAVRAALEKEGWVITQDPLFIKVEDIEFYIDLGGERIIAAQKDTQKIAVEIKSFLGSSEVSDFHLALGQFLNYRLALKKKQPERVLYLAVPVDVYDEFFSRPFIQEVIAEYNLKLLIFDAEKEEIVLWRH